MTNEDLDDLIRRADAYLAWLDSPEHAEAVEAAVDEAFLRVCGRTYRADEVLPAPIAPPAPIKSDAHSNGDGKGQVTTLAQLKKDFPSLFGEGDA